MNRWLPALLIIVLLAGFRLLGSFFSESIPNLQPLPAIMLCSFVFLQGAWRWALPLGIWLITDPLTSLLQGYPVIGPHNLSVALGVAVILGISLLVRRRPTALPVLGASLASAVAFYFLTNLLSFIGDPLYPKTLEGFVQAQWTGPIGHGPTWVFLRNMVAGNLLFTALFLAARHSLPVRLSVPSPESAR